MKYPAYALVLMLVCCKEDKPSVNHHTSIPTSPCAAVTQQQQFDCFMDSLNNAGATDLDKVNEIRKYFALKVDMGNSLDPLANDYEDDPDWSTVDPFECMQGFDDNELTGKCGFCSAILVKLYEYAGYEAYRYRCGFAGKEYATHKFVLVKLDSQWIVEDGFYNFTITDTNNIVRDFLQMIPEIKAGDFSNIVVNKEPLSSELWLENVSELDSLTAIFGKFGIIQSVDTINGRIRVYVKRDYSTLTDAALRLMAPVLQQEGLPVNYLSLFIKPISVRNSSNVEMDSIMHLLLN